MSYKKCAICKRILNETTKIISRKDQFNALNYYYFERLAPGSNLVKRLDMHMLFTDDFGNRLMICRKCFQAMMEDMLNGSKKGGFNWLDQEDKGS